MQPPVASEAEPLDTMQIAFAPTPEDQARADFYALLARLYVAAPDATLLRTIAEAADLVSEGRSDELATAWRALCAASAAAESDAASEEYQDLFIGVGQSPVSLYGSHHLTGFMMEKPLAELRTTLTRLGLARQPGVNLVEDHLAAVCETMRVLIAGADGGPSRSLADQRAFFDAHIEPWVFSCCNAIEGSPISHYYRRVAAFTRCLMAIERDSFDIE